MTIYLMIKTGEVLIDTWWNVNSYNQEQNILFSRFNRYMVECECSLTSSGKRSSRVLIDTWWNVNLSTVIDLNTSLKF